MKQMKDDEMLSRNQECIGWLFGFYHFRRGANHIEGTRQIFPVPLEERKPILVTQKWG